MPRVVFAVADFHLGADLTSVSWPRQGTLSATAHPIQMRKRNEGTNNALSSGFGSGRIVSE